LLKARSAGWLIVNAKNEAVAFAPMPNSDIKSYSTLL